VPGGPAYKHLEPGDVLVRVNGEVSLLDGKSCPLPKKFFAFSFGKKSFALFLSMFSYVSCVFVVVLALFDKFTW